VAQRVRRKRKLTAEEKFQVFCEAASAAMTETEVCRRWGIEIWDLRRIRQVIRSAALPALRRGPGTPRRTPRPRSCAERRSASRRPCWS